MAPEVGLEPTTLRLTAECSAIELLRNRVCAACCCFAAQLFSYNKPCCLGSKISGRRCCTRGSGEAPTLERNDVRVDDFVHYGHLRQGHRKIEAARPGAARVQVEHALALLNLRAMRVPTHHHRDPRGLRTKVKVGDRMHQVEIAPAQLHHIAGRQRPAHAAHVHIAAYRRQRSDPAQFVQNQRVAHVSRVQNMVHADQRLNRLRPQQPMRVGDDSDGQGLPRAFHHSPVVSRMRGSRKSRSASPMKLNESTASMTASAGTITRCGESNRCERPSFSMEPQLAAGGGTPSPRKLSVASASTAPAIPMAACTISGWTMLGRMWRHSMRRSDAASARAASTNSRSFTAITCARTSRAYPTQPEMESARMRLKIPGPRNATNAMASRIPGRSRNAFVTYTFRTVSVHPP